MGRQSVFDLIGEAIESDDVTPSGDWTREGDESDRSRLLAMAREAQMLCGKSDKKMIKAVALVKAFLKDGYSPIVFCRFIPTADYLAEELRKSLGKVVTVDSVTGVLSPEDREARIQALGEAERGKRVLVCTDCLSEGINLQNYFDAVLHYDLSWNPTRHEQRDGRVDRLVQQFFSRFSFSSVTSQGSKPINPTSVISNNGCKHPSEMVPARWNNSGSASKKQFRKSVRGFWKSQVTLRC